MASSTPRASEPERVTRGKQSARGSSGCIIGGMIGDSHPWENRTAGHHISTPSATVGIFHSSVSSKVRQQAYQGIQTSRILPRRPRSCRGHDAREARCLVADEDCSLRRTLGGRRRGQHRSVNRPGPACVRARTERPYRAGAAPITQVREGGSSRGLRASWRHGVEEPEFRKISREAQWHHGLSEPRRGGAGRRLASGPPRL
jgi:hypothetical protein